VFVNRFNKNFKFQVQEQPEYELSYFENAKGAYLIVGNTIEEI